MMHDYPDRLDAYSLDEEMPPPVRQRGLGKIVLALMMLSIAIATLVTQIDWQEAYDRVFADNGKAATSPVATKEQIELIAVTQADQTKVAAEGEAAVLRRCR